MFFKRTILHFRRCQPRSLHLHLNQKSCCAVADQPAHFGTSQQSKLSLHRRLGLCTQPNTFFPSIMADSDDSSSSGGSDVGYGQPVMQTQSCCAGCQCTVQICRFPCYSDIARCFGGMMSTHCRHRRSGSFCFFRTRRTMCANSNNSRHAHAHALYDCQCRRAAMSTRMRASRT